MAVGAVGDPAAEQDAAHRPDHVAGQRRRGGFEGQPVGAVQYRDQPGLDAGAGHRRHHEKPEKQHDRPRQQLGAYRPGTRPAGRRGSRFCSSRMRLCQHDRQHDRHADQADQQQRLAPAEQPDQRGGNRRRGGEPDMADKGMDRKRAAEPRLVDRAAQDRVIGRMESPSCRARTASPARRSARYDGRQPHRRDRQGHQQVPPIRKRRAP